ncbi:MULTISPECIES: SDR family NAD(P)-dependent oxidoreductase [Pseudonocardia]|uniref:3-oxoacyl-[acyl-carrier-protein] reductase FabG n=2 Tax=Pseudonocardia TaxID=1847 RepID=A0A1Y2MP88_PSEAH|nr:MULTISPECIES: SDR family oxidoreductase [Pseudonocardia]OSY36288.1 3-oxoacyl-[acyl-carrier-protein] reductase FabG [Pseudonocardia autotrophica]TDN73093.1 NAD(P)-dependent dehydrogenase (short-subunit alcohol dehydrogenase family) [Pseudonocardia autotrophica]BBG03813.1 oxidoreductase [Pseudonocardia autotrophica]GEC26579.1 oxidoreductase [Pseudonocardia saturnea]
MSEKPTGSAVVVGGARGIGLAAVGLATSHVAAMTVLDLPETAPQVTEAFPGARYLQADVLDRASLEKGFALAAESGPVTAVFVPAGITLPTPLLEVTQEDAQRCLMINIMGSINAIQAAAPHLAAGASIVLCASVAAYTGGGYVGGPVYGASKAGVIGLTKGAARELADRQIRVNCIAPGCTSTSMIGDDPEVIATLSERALVGRLAAPEEIAQAALYLWSSASSFMTGAVLDVNGGIRL